MRNDGEIEEYSPYLLIFVVHGRSDFTELIFMLQLNSVAYLFKTKIFHIKDFGLVQGPRMVRDVFRLAKENAPAIVFIDEVDAIATARFDAQTGADREVQRILMELLNQVLF